MSRNVSIGDFARMTHLSVKTLRHYHDVGLLVPDDVDHETGYRYYAHSQVAIAHMIKRFRALGMPVDEVRALLEAPDPTARNALIVAHLDRLERQLAGTQAAVVSLRALVERPAPVIEIEYRAVGELAVLAISEHIELADLSRWWPAAFAELRALVAEPTGPAGALFATELFSDEAGAVSAFIPSTIQRESGRARPTTLPAVELALTLHRGSHDDIDRTYGALGTHVAEQELGFSGPIREHYLVDRFQTKDARSWRTEIGWPILRR